MNTSDLKLYEIGTPLGDEEYLLKIRPKEDWKTKAPLTSTGFLTKLTKKKEIPKSFLDWGETFCYNEPNEPKISLPIFVYTETFKYGWKLKDWRYGQSQNWARVIHPDNFIVEIYLSTFLHIVNDNTIIKGVIQGEFKWENNTLIKLNGKDKETRYSTSNCYE